MPKSHPKRPAIVAKSDSAAAKQLGVTRQAFSQWRRDRPEFNTRFPKPPYSAKQVEAMRAFRAEFILPDMAENIRERTNVDGAGDDGSPDSLNIERRAKLNLVHQRAKKIETERMMLTGDLIPVEQVERDRLAKVAAVKAALLSLGRTMAPLLVGLSRKEIEDLIYARTVEICEAFSTK